MPKKELRTRYALHRGARGTALLHALLKEKLGSDEYALFYVTGEGRALPISTPGDDVEETSACAIHRSGRVFFFSLGWDGARGGPALTQWLSEKSAPEWDAEPECRQARQRVGHPSLGAHVAPGA